MKLTSAFGLILWLGSLLTGCAASDSSPPCSPHFTHSMERELRAIGERAVNENGIVGLSIGVAMDGRVVFAEGFGHVDAGRTAPATAHTVYDVASVGKQFTAVAILSLVERGALSLDQRVRSLVPGLPDHFPDATVEQLLRHTSGFVSGDFDPTDPPADYARPRYGAELLTDLELQTGKLFYGEQEMWTYSNAGYLVLGMIVEVVAGERYDRFVRRELLGLLTPHAMFVCEYPPDAIGSQRLRRTEQGVAPVPYIDMTAWSGQGSICSSVVDLLRWSDALNYHRLIDEDALELMRSPSVVHGDYESAEIPYGMGQRLGTLGGHQKVGHTGTFFGGSAALVYYPDAGLEIAVLANTRGHGTPHAFSIEAAIAKQILSIDDDDPLEYRAPLSEAQRRAIQGEYNRADDVLAATFDGDELVVMRGGRELERLVHIGDLRFRKPGMPDVLQWFLLDGERAGWWVYMRSGNSLEVHRRVNGDAGD